MIQGLKYSSGPITHYQARPASAISIGDVLMLDSTSSVSVINITLASGVDIFGIACAGSDQSISHLIPVLIPEAETEFLASLDTALSSEVTPGVEMDLAYSLANGRHYFTTASSNSVRGVCVRGTAGDYALDQSVSSQVIVKLIYHAGNLELS